MEDKKPLVGMGLENYQETVKILDMFVLAKPTIDLLKINSDFQNLVCNDISILEKYEKNFVVETENFSRFASAYGAITGKTYVFNDSINIENEIEINDAINYNKVFLKNVIHLSFEKLETYLSPQTEKVEAVETTNQEVQKAMKEGKVDTSNQTDNENINASNQHRNYGTNEYGPGVFDRLSAEATEQFINNSAVVVFNSHVRKGDVYIYKTKPVIIPILKWITIVGYAAILIFIIASMFFSGFAKGLNIPLKGNNGETQNQLWGGVTQFQILQLFLSFFILGMGIYSIIKTFKNDNQRYKYSWISNIFYLGFLMMFGAIGVFAITLNSNFLKEIQSANSPENITKFNSFNNYLIMNYTLFGLIGGLIIVTVIGAISNPKRDFERINNLIKQYASQIREGSIDLGKYSNNSADGIFSQFGF